MKEKEILRKTIPHLTDGESKELEREDHELYMFLRGGFAAK